MLSFFHFGNWIFSQPIVDFAKRSIFKMVSFLEHLEFFRAVQLYCSCRIVFGMFLEKKVQPKLPKFESKFKSEADVTSLTLTLNERHTATTTCNTWMKKNRKSVHESYGSIDSWGQLYDDFI